MLMTAMLGLMTLAGTTDGWDRPKVELWTNRGDATYARGDAVHVNVRSDQDGYVTILRVDTDGRIRVLFPRDPWEDNFVRGGREFELLGNQADDAFRIDDYPGVGYLFAIVSPEPFVYDQIETADHWDYRAIADVRGDPYVALTDLAGRIVARGDSDWDYDIVPYYVERHYDYPRFLCYDCHQYVSYRTWDPYDYSCVRFRVVVYDDPFYYPYRTYGGTSVVFTRPYRPGPRFIFKDQDGRSPFVSRERERPVNDNGRRRVSGDGGGGTGLEIIPPPRERHPDGRPGDQGGGHDGNGGGHDGNGGGNGNGGGHDRNGGGHDGNGGGNGNGGDNNGRRRRPGDDGHPDQPGRPSWQPILPDRPSDQRQPSDRGSSADRGRRDQPDQRPADRPAQQRPSDRGREQSRPADRPEPRAQPQPRPERQSAPRAEPKRDPPPKSSSDPSLRRRKP
ncbi:MAG TPA: DUF4384 domain-containing protein [Gemmatimonadales bacterium]